MSWGRKIAGSGDQLVAVLFPRIVTATIMRQGFALEETPRYRDEFLVRRPGATVVADKTAALG